MTLPDMIIFIITNGSRQAKKIVSTMAAEDLFHSPPSPPTAPTQATTTHASGYPLPLSSAREAPPLSRQKKHFAKSSCPWSRVLVGWFVALALLLLLFGFGFGFSTDAFGFLLKSKRRIVAVGSVLTNTPPARQGEILEFCTHMIPPGATTEPALLSAPQCRSRQLQFTYGHGPRLQAGRILSDTTARASRRESPAWRANGRQHLLSGP